MRSISKRRPKKQTFADSQKVMAQIDLEMPLFKSRFFGSGAKFWSDFASKSKSDRENFTPMPTLKTSFSSQLLSSQMQVELASGRA